MRHEQRLVVELGPVGVVAHVDQGVVLRTLKPELSQGRVKANIYERKIQYLFYGEKRWYEDLLLVVCVA